MVALQVSELACEARHSPPPQARPLHLAGALLTRLQPPPKRRAAPRGDRYEYSVAHVDRANVASYDYSAVLYLNTQACQTAADSAADLQRRHGWHRRR